VCLYSKRILTEYSVWPGWLATGTSDIYAYVDSFNPGVAAGALVKRDETNSRAELHGLSVAGRNPALARSAAPATMPARMAICNKYQPTSSC